jgi:hypothetical protein
MNFLFYFFALITFSVNALADQSDFLSLCKVHFKDDLNRVETCEKMNKILFYGLTTKDASTLTNPQKINAPVMDIDKKIIFMALNDPNYLPALVYCYSVFNHWINPKQISPDTLGMISSGVSILNEKLPAYQKWLNTSAEGKSCRQLVEKESQLPVTNLEDSLKDHVAMIVLNPYAVIANSGTSFESAMEELRLTLNHERTHAYHVLCPQFEKSEKEKWNKLTDIEKNKMMTKYPNYNWKDLQTAARESSAFNLETTPEVLRDLVKSCKIK